MTYSLKALSSLKDIAKEDWDRCANPMQSANPLKKNQSVRFDPFVSYDFLFALEQSQSACPETGWAPYHLVLSHEEKGVCGVVAMYLKNHSQGEYVFDYAWADAFERAGGNYYPKLQVSVPFTPATGRRLLIADTDLHDEVREHLLAGIIQVSEKLGVSSVHLTFLDKAQFDETGKLGFLQRTHNQFHWVNNDYEDFDDFLSQLSSKKRKNIKNLSFD